MAEGAYRIHPRVIRESFEDEVVMINLESGNYYSLNGVGGEIWGYLEKGAAARGIAAALAARYAADGEQIGQSVNDFLGQLLQEKLIVESEADSIEPLPLAAEGKLPFEIPQMSVFSDMQDLLLLDPIHDVDEAGWPVRPADQQ